LLGADDAAALRLLGGPDARVVQPDVEDEQDLEFYAHPEAPPPARPWLMSPVELEPLSVTRLADTLESEGRLPPDQGQGSIAREILRRIGAAGDVRATLYAPESPTSGGELRVELLVTERLACAGSVASAFPGFVLRIVAPDVSPKLLLRPWSKEGEATVGGMLSSVVVRLATGVLETAARRLLAGIGQLSVAPGSTAARIALAALARSAIKRLRTAPGEGTRIRFALLDPGLPDALLAAPILRTLDGVAHSLHDLEAQMESTGGLVYGVVREVPADLHGLDLSRILDLDPQQERMLISLLGEASYVRVDARDVLAECDGVRCRDVAFGLRPFPNFPLLVEGDDPSSWPAPRRVRCEQALVDRLIAVLRSHPDEELRRQAVRHLLWYLYRRTAHGLGGPDDRGVSRLPLFLDIDGVGRSFEELRPALASPEGVAMYDGWSVDAADLGPLVAAASPTSAAVAPPPADAARFRRLAMNPFALHLLSRLGRVRPTFDFDLSDAEALADPAPPETAYVAQVAVDDELVAGTIGIPVVDVADPAIAVVEPQTRRVLAMREAARQTGAVGRLVAKGSALPPELLGTVVERAMALLLTELARRIAALPAGSAEHERCTRAGLRLAGRKVVLTALPDGSVVVDLLDSAARRLLDLPLFPTTLGVSVSAVRFLQEFAVASSVGGSAETRTVLAPDAPAYLRAWLDEMLVARRIVRPACTPAPAAQPAFVVESLPGMPEEVLARWLTEALRLVCAETGTPAAPLEVSIEHPRAYDRLGRFDLLRSPLSPSDPLPSSLVVNAEHWLVARTRRCLAGDPEAAVWLLLACYAQLNADFQAIANTAEMEFQECVLELLERGALRLPGPAVPPQTP
jgi:hypothetical protein